MERLHMRVWGLFLLSRQLIWVSIEGAKFIEYN